ncbi:hypothetical protein IKP13_09255 [bacterium]|nr:hypothetical protein [bacterium]
MKRFLTLIFIFSVLIPFSVSATMIKLTVNYSRSDEKSDQYRVDIRDGYWNFPVVEVPKGKEREQYSVIIEGYNSTSEAKKEKIGLSGADFSRKKLLCPKSGVIVIENTEKFPRKISIAHEGGEASSLEIQPQSSVEYQFNEVGDYTMTDEMFPWNTASVKVLGTTYVWRLKDGSNNKDIPDIAPGSYSLKIYYGTKDIYTEDFMVVQNAAQSFIYKIEKGRVNNLNAISTSMD